MSSDIPGFHDSGSEEDEARWEAYRALLRRTAPRHPDAVRATFEAPDDAFEPEEDWGRAEEPEAVGADADFETAPDAADPADNLVIHRVMEPTSPPQSSRRLVVGVMAVIAGIILAAALVPREPREQVIVLRGAPIFQGERPVLAKPASSEPLAEVATSQSSVSPEASAKAAPEPIGRRTAPHHVATLAAAARHPVAPAVTPAPPSGKGSLDCWVSAMNGRGSSDGGLSVCGNPAPNPPPSRPGDGANP